MHKAGILKYMLIVYNYTEFEGSDRHFPNTSRITARARSRLSVPYKRTKVGQLGKPGRKLSNNARFLI